MVFADLYFAPFWFFTRNYNAMELSSKQLKANLIGRKCQKNKNLCDFFFLVGLGFAVKIRDKMQSFLHGNDT